MKREYHGEIASGRWSPEYIAWRNMNLRCHDKNHHNYSYYGGRGITVCDRWRFGTEDQGPVACFVEDMGRCPSKWHSLDRKDNSISYSPSNCRWATRKEQANNRRVRRNAVGLPGVSLQGGKFRARRRINGVMVHLGYFKTAADASAAWATALGDC